ncbi:Uma2 family endonuclease, partial [Singulisphaera rosea]
VMSPDSPEHDAISEPLRDLLGAYRLANRQVVERVVSEAWVRIPGGTDRIGDIGVYLVAGSSDVSRPDRAPELMFEVVSEGKASADRDYREKRLDYHRIGVLEYVILDRLAGRATVLTYDRDGYRERVVPRSGTYESPLLPRLAIPIAELLP